MEKDWEHVLKEAIENKSIQLIKKEKRSYERYLSMLRKLVAIHIILGIAAAIILYLNFGWEELIKTFLSWVIGITLVATIVTATINRFPKFN